MIVFKNGEFLGGDLMDIIHIDWDDAPDSCTWWDHLLYDEVVVLRIPKDDKQIQIFVAFSEELEFIPRQSENDRPFHSLFWESAETYVFGDFDRAIQFMKVYEGAYQKEVKEALAQIQQQMLHEDARDCFQCTCDLGEYANPDSMNDLTEFVMEHEASMEEVLASMKLYMLDFYKTELESSGRYT